jgi:acyl-CoA synthetase (AMP-forming)/AMP-acid ligase II
MRNFSPQHILHTLERYSTIMYVPDSERRRATPFPAASAATQRDEHGAGSFTTFQTRALEAPDAPFLILPDAAVITYGAALARCGQMAGLFRSLGVQPGDRVAVQVEKSATALLTYLAAQAVGAVYLPLNTAYTAAEVRFFLGDARPALFIHRPQDEAAMAALCTEIGVPARLTLDADETGTLTEGLAAHGRRWCPIPPRGMTWPPFSTPRAPPAAPRGRC